MTPFQIIGWLLLVISSGAVCFMWGRYCGEEAR
jgi:hypothetical protein